MTDASNMKNSEVSDYDSIEEIGAGFFNGSEKSFGRQGSPLLYTIERCVFLHQ